MWLLNKFCDLVFFRQPGFSSATIWVLLNRWSQFSPLIDVWRRGLENSKTRARYINMSTVSSDASTQRHHWQPLSVHLWAYCNPPLALVSLAAVFWMSRNALPLLGERCVTSKKRLRGRLPLANDINDAWCVKGRPHHCENLGSIKVSGKVPTYPSP